MFVKEVIISLKITIYDIKNVIRGVLLNRQKIINHL